MKIPHDPELRGTWLIYFVGTGEISPLHGTLTEAIHHGTRDGTQFSGGRLGVVIVPIEIELPEPQIEGGDGKIISMAAAISGAVSAPEPILDEAAREARQAEYSKALKARQDGDAPARKDPFACSRCGARFPSAAKTLTHRLACKVDIAMNKCALPKGAPASVARRNEKTTGFHLNRPERQGQRVRKQ